MPGTTPVTLLDRLRRQPDDEGWRRLHDIYVPVLCEWLRRQRVPASDADDLVQEVLSVVVRRLAEFRHAGQPGSFRAWLRAILANQVRAFWRTRQQRPVVGGSEVAAVLQQLEDPASDLSRCWDEEHDRAVTLRLLQLIEPEFERATMRAFRGLVIDGRPTAAVAADTGLTPNAVRIAKSRVMQRLRQEIGGLVD